MKAKVCLVDWELDPVRFEAGKGKDGQAGNAFFNSAAISGVCIVL
ncbi:hypothetical protein [Pelotalea chapellei]|nr:hypothetical protein [Pelotalea chapellei]